MIDYLPYTFGVAIFAMAVTQFTKQMTERKPFSCELCMTFWLSFAVILTQTLDPLSVTFFVGLSVFWRQLLFKLWATMF